MEAHARVRHAPDVHNKVVQTTFGCLYSCLPKMTVLPIVSVCSVVF